MTPGRRAAAHRLVGAIIAALALAALAGCTKDPKEAAARAVADGTALKQVKALVDGRAQCARMLFGWEPIDMIDAEDVALPAMQALIGAGLLEPVPDQSTQDQPVYRSSAAAQPFVRKRPLNAEKETLDLCYGKRQVTRVWVDEKWTDYGSLPYVQYAYRIVDPAAWVTPAMRRTFPFLEYVLGTELVSQDMMPVKDGEVTMSLPMDDIMYPEDTIATFSFCPDGVEAPVGRCLRVEEQRMDHRKQRALQRPTL